jgi:hypothetical protein
MIDYEQRKDLRPEVPTEPATNPTEQFQNETLRPILKMQHELLAALSDHYLTKRKVPLGQTAKAQRREKLKEMLTRDNRFRSLLFGMVIGQFTPEEMLRYLENEGDHNRRITSMLIDRLLSVYE